MTAITFDKISFNQNNWATSLFQKYWTLA